MVAQFRKMKAMSSLVTLVLLPLVCCWMFCSVQSRSIEVHLLQQTQIIEQDINQDRMPQLIIQLPGRIHGGLKPKEKQDLHDEIGKPDRSHDDDDERSERERPEHDEPDHRRGHDHDYDEAEGSPFILEKPIKLITTEAGEMRILPRGRDSVLARQQIGLKFLILEPMALLLPQYIDASCVFLVHKGRARLSWVDDAKLKETDMEEGDIYKLEGGTVFYVFNSDEGQRLQIFSILDTHAVFDRDIFHNFFVAGGEDPRPVLSGFDEDVLATAFNVSAEEVRDVLTSQTQGSIVYSIPRNDTKAVRPSHWSFEQMLRKYLGITGISQDNPSKPYNILKKKKDFSNAYGWSATADGNDFDGLKDVNKGAFAVSLKAGALLAPHWNPRATEIGLVTNGDGEIQIAFPNGTTAASAPLSEGSVFYVPQYYPMCQIASRSGPFEFMGFSTSAKPNRPQFLAGSNSVLKALKEDILATSFNIPADHLRHFFAAQSEAVILPGQPVEPQQNPIR